MSAKLEVQWTPIPNKFITWGSEICLYDIQPLSSDNVLQSVRLSNSTCANLLATNTSHHYIKCLDIYPKSDEADILMAVGLSNGRIALSTFGPTDYDAQGLTGKELVPRHGRQCNAVSWNSIETNLVATGLDKYKGDNSVLIWDITKLSLPDNSRLATLNTMPPPAMSAKPIAEFGVSETAHSLSWFSGSNAKIMAVGMNQKYIKLFDTRDPNKLINSTMTKAVFGVCVDPNDDRHLASFSDNYICVWDTRNFEKPILTLPSNNGKGVIKIKWCPTKHNVLGSLQKDSSLINLYDIQHTIIGNEEVEPSVLERIIDPGAQHSIMSFSWHSSDENRFLTVSLNGAMVDYTVFDRITVNWAPTSNVVWTYDRKTMKCLNDDPLQDVSTKIKKRALAGYGLKDEMYKNGELVQDNEMLSNVWSWLYISGKLVEDGGAPGCQWKHPGVTAILKLDPNKNKCDSDHIPWGDMETSGSTVRIFTHEDRKRALHLCSWPVSRDSFELSKFLEQLEKEGAYTRAAAIAVFNLKIRLAIDILSRASEHHDNQGLNVVALALAGFTDDRNSTWRKFCQSIRHKLTDPYLKIMFGFLCAENYNYDTVLNESGVAVDDRVAFACIFLPDNRLCDYLKRLSEKLIEEGNLDGLLLTGDTSDGIRLLQKYLDATGDVQSTALIAVRAFRVEQFLEPIKEWILNYSNLLDTWQLWNERCNLDIMLNKHCPPDEDSQSNNNNKPPQQVFVSCNFCGKSISTYVYGYRGASTRGGGTGTFGRSNSGNTAANKTKMSACPNCRKPLPRCAICLVHMGTTTRGRESDDKNAGASVKTADFSSWFTWCQTCRHGGHASHMTHWFKEHSECPVTACTCKCFSVDSIA